MIVVVRSRLIGIILPTGESFGRGIAHGILSFRRAIRPEWEFIFAGNSSDDPLHFARKWTGDAIIAQAWSQRRISDLAQCQIPVVNVSNSITPPGGYRVISDDLQVGRVAAESLLNLKLTNFAAFSMRDRVFSQERIAGFRARLQEAGMDCDVFDGELRQTKRWLARLPKPVGILAANDVLARMVITSCQSIGLRVPDAVSVLGVDNDDLQCEMSILPLSSVMLDLHRIGYEAAQTIDLLLNKTYAPRITRIPPLRVVARRSTDFLAVDDAEVSGALRFIRKNAVERIGVQDIADALSISRRTLERRFVAVLGHSPHVEIRKVRVDSARQLLIETDLPMPAVAARAGFRDANLLSILFRQATGQTPTQYRRQYRTRPHG